MDDERLPVGEGPVIVAAFEGWNDAGSAASDAARFLASALDTSEVGTVSPDPHVDYQASRPHTEIVSGVIRDIAWPVTRILASADTSVLVVLGAEPSFRWQLFGRRITDTARAVDARLIVTLGALLDDSPHRRPTNVTGVASDESLTASLRVRTSRYEGPTGIVGVLHRASVEAGIPSASLWASVPHYASSAPSPKASVALLSRVDAITGVGIDLGRLEVAASAWERQVDAVVAKSEELEAYVRDLEARYDEAERLEAPPATPDPADEDPIGDVQSGDALAADIERFLRNRDEE